MTSHAASFASRLQPDTTLLHLTATNEIGRLQHLYVACSPRKAPPPLEAWKAGAITQAEEIAPYGTIIAQHFGRFPREDVRQMLRETYGVEV